jgi:hydrogenase maturation protease
MDRIAVIGLGNVLMGDDGFGPTVVRHLEAEYTFEPGVAVQDLGTPGLNLLPFVAGTDALIVIDTVNSDASPGALKLYRREDILRHPPGPRINPHDPGLKESILNAEIAGEAPREVLLVGVIPEFVDKGTELTPSLRAAIPGAVRAVLDELERLGAPAHLRTEPETPDLWWRAPSSGTSPDAE